MDFNLDSAINNGAFTLRRDGNSIVPWEFTNAKDEYLAERTTASLGIFLNHSPIVDITGADAEKFLNYIGVNIDYNKMKVGSSRHAIFCNEKGQMLASGVILKTEEGRYRTYWMAPAILYYAKTLKMNVKAEVVEDEYFYQIDGPKSLEILEEATQTDLHDIKFARNRKVKICGTDMIIFRLGMSGALAYEVHGAGKDAEIAYNRLREVLVKHGGKLQGYRNYISINHTPGGYPNQFQHFWYPFLSSGEGMAEFCKNVYNPRHIGSAADNDDNYYASPYDRGWGYLVDFEHGDFIGREALLTKSKNQTQTMVTLEWDADDVGKVFASQFKGKDVEPYDQIEHISSMSDTAYGASLRADYVLADGKKIGVSTGKTYAFYEQRMVSLACIDNEYAKEGTQVSVLWGTVGTPQIELRATVARFPYYNGEFRNETFDTEKIPHPTFK